MMYKVFYSRISFIFFLFAFIFNSASSTLSEKNVNQKLKCPLVCQKGSDHMVLIQTAFDNSTGMNIPLYNDTMAIVYYKCKVDSISNFNLTSSKFNTFQKVCRETMENCIESISKFENQWFELKNGNDLYLNVNFTLPKEKALEIKIEQCGLTSSEQTIFNFYYNKRLIDFRNSKEFSFINGKFVAKKKKMKPIELKITKYKTEGIANVKFYTREVPPNPCYMACDGDCKRSSTARSGFKCILHFKGKIIAGGYKYDTCKTRATTTDGRTASSSNTKGACELSGQRLCSRNTKCFNRPNCGYLCGEVDDNNVGTIKREYGYLAQMKSWHNGPIGSGNWKWNEIPPEKVLFDECRFNKSMCRQSDCIDLESGFKCSNDKEPDSEICSTMSTKSPYWICPFSVKQWGQKFTTNNNMSTNDFLLNSMMNSMFQNNNPKIVFEGLMLILDKWGMSDSGTHKGPTLFSGVSMRISAVKVMEQMENTALSLALNDPKDDESLSSFSNDRVQLFSKRLDAAVPVKRFNIKKKSGNQTPSTSTQFIELRIKDQDTGFAKSKKVLSSVIYYNNSDFMGDRVFVDKTKNQAKVFRPPQSEVQNEVKMYQNSDIVSVKVDEESVNTEVQFRINSYEKPVQTSWLYSFEEKCGFLDLERGWKWSTKDCVTLTDKDGAITCQCSHLTNFAMLFAITPINKAHYRIFQILSIFGGVINCIALVLFLIFVLFINSRDKMRLDQLNVALSLLMGTLVFLVGGLNAGNEGNGGTGCAISAMLAQFLLLSAFSWKLILGINVVRMLASIRYQEDWLVKYRWIMIAVGYSVPLLITVISASILYDQYGLVSDNVCWIKPRSAAFLTFLVPVSIVVAVNLIALAYIGKVLLYNYINTRKTKVNDSNELLVFLQLLVSMGFTWVPCYFATIYVAAMYIMLLAFPLQGLLMFMLVVVVNKENREKVSSFLHSITSKSTTSSSSEKNSSKSKTSMRSKLTEQSDSLLSPGIDSVSGSSNSNRPTNNGRHRSQGQMILQDVPEEEMRNNAEKC